MKLDKFIIKNITKNIDLMITDSLNLKELYKSINAIASVLNYRNLNKISINNDISLKSKIIIIFYCLIFNTDLYIYKYTDNCLFIENEGFLHNIINDVTINYNLIKNRKNIQGKIYYKISDDKYSHFNIKNISEFIYNFNKIFLSYLENKTKFNLNSLELQFLPFLLPFILKYKLINSQSNDDDTLFISSIYQKKSTDIFISNKFTFIYPEAKNILFYSFTLNQFILYDVDTKNSSDYIEGKLLNNFKVDYSDKSTLLYLSKKLNLPKTYQLISENKMKIYKKSTKVKSNNYNNISKQIECTKIFNPNSFQINKDYGLNYSKKKISNQDDFIIKKNFSKLIFIDCKKKICKIDGTRLFNNLIKLFPNNFKKDFLFRYNSEFCENNSSFVMYILSENNSSKIIIQLSKIFSNLESKILSNLNLLLSNHDFNIIHIEDVKYNKSINIFHEFRLGYTILKYILPKLFKYLFNYSPRQKKINSRRQYIYKFDSKELEVFKCKSKLLNLSVSELFRISLFKSLNILFQDMLILFSDEKNTYLYPNNFYDYESATDIKKILSYYNNAKYLQNFIKSLVFTLLNKLNNIESYSNLIIQVDEISIFDLTDIDISKTNIRCSTNSVPIQICYYISDDEINLTISGSSNIEKISLICNLMLKIISNDEDI